MVRAGRVVHEPANLGRGWVGFDLESAFGKPTKVVNDAAMQALGSYDGGRMLFLGLGTGLGSTMIVDGIVEPMELGHLPFRKATYEDYVGIRGLEAPRQKRWQKAVYETIELVAALEPEYVVLGGGQRGVARQAPAGRPDRRTTRTPSSAGSGSGRPTTRANRDRSGFLARDERAQLVLTRLDDPVV